jgi:hypothetical protein
MSCERYDEAIVDIARGEEPIESRPGDALAHVEGCVRCAARLSEERSVTSALRAFATRTAGAEAPFRVEAALVRALREPREAAGSVRKGPSRAVELLRLAAAAAILAAIVAVPPRYDPLREPSWGLPSASPGLVALPADSEEDAEFVALRYGEDLRELDSLQVVSVELPATALAALGWPEVAAQTSVKAEVIVGHDGVARAIRFVD